MSSRRHLAGLVILLCCGCGDAGSGPALPCWVGKDFSVAESASDLRRLPPESEWVRARGIPDEAVAELARFPRLRQLDLGTGSKDEHLRLRISAKGLSELADLGLKRLDTLTLVASPELDDACLRQIARISTLDHLCLERCTGFSKTAFAALAGLPRLQGLNVRGCTQIDDDWIDAVARLDGLRSVQVAGTRLSPEGRARLRSLLGSGTVDDDEERWAVEK